MGIPAYFSYIIKNHKQIIKQIETLSHVDNLYMDCNSIIYDAFHSLDDKTNNVPKNIIKSVITKIKHYITNINPKNNIILAFDGVAPVAKLEQQRTRRTRSQFLSSINSTIHNKPNNYWNTNAITPGTEFMTTLGVSIINEFKYNRKIIVNFFEPGEGEHKIFDFIRNYPEKHVGYNTIIYGLDADLIMLSINHLPITNQIYLFRETPEFIRSLDSSLNPNKLYMIDIPLLSNQITLDMNNNKEVTGEQQKRRIYDYIFLCFLLGNDFMPHFPSINIRTNGIDILLDVYRNTLGNTDENLTDGKTISWKNVRKIIYKLANNEENYLKNEHIKRDKGEKRFFPTNTGEEKENKFMSIPTFDRVHEKYINPFEPGWQKRYYKTLFNVDIDDTRRQQICHNYIEALEWTFKYYSSGCYNWRWKYNYNYAPLLEDLIKYIPYFDTDFIKYQTPNPVTAKTQLAYVLPRSSHNLLEKDTTNKLHQYIDEWYPEDFEFKYAYCKYFWESHLELPEISIHKLEQIVN